MDYPDETERTMPLFLRLVNDEKGGWQRGGGVIWLTI